MDEAKLSFLLESIQSLTFVNPFAGERDKIEKMIISRLGWTEKLQETNSKFTKEFNQVLHWVREGEQVLLMGKGNKFALLYGLSKKGILGIFFSLP